MAKTLDRYFSESKCRLKFLQTFWLSCIHQCTARLLSARKRVFSKYIFLLFDLFNSNPFDRNKQELYLRMLKLD